jgi:hypothetical protein
MLAIGDSGTTVEPIGTWTYTMSDRLVAYGLMGDGTTARPRWPPTARC